MRAAPARAPAVMLFVVACMLTVSACTPRVRGYAVVLWPDAADAAAGGVAAVIDESQIRQTCTLRVGGEEEGVEIETWRVSRFAERDEAEAFSAAYEPWVRTWAFTDRKEGLPIRDRADQQATRVYKARPAQLMKVIGRAAEQQRAGAYEGYWYEVLTDDGYRGFCFGYTLTVFEAAAEEAAAVMQSMLAEDPVLEQLLRGTWRPEYYADMISEDKIDLERFREDIGLFPEPDERAILLVTSSLHRLFEYQSVEKTGEGRYIFPPTELKVSVFPNQRLEATYREGDRTVRTVFVRLAADVEEVIEEETARREALYEELRAYGDVLSSSTYGTVVLGDEMRFTWVDHERVPPSVLPAEVPAAGRVDFRHHLGPELALRYAGAVSFIFDGYGAADEVVFVYSFLGGGIQLTHIRNDDIEDFEIEKLSASPLIVFFTVGDSS